MTKGRQAVNQWSASARATRRRQKEQFIQGLILEGCWPSKTIERARNPELLLGFGYQEIAVMGLLRVHDSDKQISEELLITASTLNEYKRRIFSKWGVHSSRRVAVLWDRWMRALRLPE